MKIKQVCELTGLTPRAVRFYTEKGLLPRGEEKAYGRTMREYTADDVRALQDIVTLRESGFTVQEILSMQQSPQNISPLVQARIAALREEVANDTAALQCLNADLHHPGWHSLAQSLRPTGASPQSKPDFSQLEDEEEGVLLQMNEEPPPKPHRKALRFCAILTAVILCLLAIRPVYALYRRSEPVSIIFGESDVKFTSLQHDRVIMIHANGYPSMTSDLFKREQVVAVDGVDTDALFMRVPYCCVTLRIEMPRYKAEQMDLLDGQGQLSLEKIRYYEQIEPYITLVGVHAG